MSKAPALSRRELLRRSGVLAVVTPRAGAPADAAEEETLDIYVCLTDEGRILAFNGHVDLGTGISTALAQIVAEELDVPLDSVEMVLGDTADTLLLGELDGAAAGAPGVFAPPPLASARGGLAMAGGVFDANGYAEIKPAFVINASLSLEPYVGLVMSASGRSLLYGGGATLNLAPDWALAPYVCLGAGGFSNLPNDDQFALSERSLFHARAGGGLLVSLRFRIILRLEATHTVLFDAESYDNLQSYVAGLGSYF